MQTIGTLKAVIGSVKVLVHPKNLKQQLFITSRK